MNVSKAKIRVNASMEVAHDPDFDFSHEVDHDEFGAGHCAEGHPIRYGYVFVNAITGEEVELGGDCQWKVFLFRKWENLQPQEITPTLIKIGEKFWNIEKDGYQVEIDEILKKAQMSIDFDKLPIREEQERYLMLIKDLLSQAIAIRKAREKELAKQREKEARMAYLQDPDFQALKNSPKFNNEYDEKAKQSVLNWFVQKGFWTESQRKNLVLKLIEKSKNQPTRDNDMEIALEIVKILEGYESGNAKNFLGDLLKYKTIQRNVLSEKQGNWLRGLYKKHYVKVGDVPLDFDAYTKQHERKD